MSFAVFLFLCPFIAVALQEKTASNIRLVSTLASKENKEAKSTNTIAITSLPLVASKFSFNNTTAFINSIISKRQCKKRLSGMIFRICKGCFHHEHEVVELEKFGQHTQKDDKKDKAHSIPSSKLNGIVMRCCNKMCSFADIKKLCCDGDEFRKTKK